VSVGLEAGPEVGGGSGVLVSGGGAGVSVSGGGTGVFVSVGGGTGVSVGTTGVLVFVGGGTGVLVSVGGGLVFVGVEGGGCVGVRLGAEVAVRAGTDVAVQGSRVRLGTVGVMVTKRRAVSVGSGVREGASVCVGRAVAVAVGTKTVTTCSVSAAAVSRLETARSTRFNGTIVTGIYRFRSSIAIAETLHSKLSPMAQAAKIPSGPEYSLALCFVSLRGRGAEVSVRCGLISICFSA
jgi:hypothetical protein